MRILQVNKFLYRKGGAEAYMEDLAGLQEAAGHEVAFFGMEHPENTHRALARWYPPRVDLEPPPPTFSGRVQAAGRMLWSISAMRGMDSALREFRPDVVHLHNIYHQLSPSILRPVARRGIPAVMTLHDYKLACPNYQFLDHGRPCDACIGGHFHRAAARRCKDGSFFSSALLATELSLHTRLGAYRSVDVLICPSAFLAGKMEQAEVMPDRLRHVPHFVDTSEVRVKDSPGGGIFFAGRLSHEKGVDTLIEAVAAASTSARLSVAGDGPERAALEELAARRAPGRVDFLGRLPKEEVLCRMRASAVVVMPSRWYENQPMIVLEAMACGVPVVGTSLGGTIELIEPGVDGEIVSADDPAALAASMDRLLAHPARTFEMGMAARRKIDEKYAPTRHLDAVLDAYDHAAARRRGHPA